MTDPIFEKKSGQEGPKSSKNGVFGVLKKADIWEKFGSRVVVQKPFGPIRIKDFSNYNISQTSRGMKLNFRN